MKIIHTHILIVGGGAAGIAAAAATKKSGLQAVLIDSHPYLGGTATAVEVGTICGLYNNGGNQSASFIVSGFARDFAMELQRLSGTHPIVNSEGLHFLPYTVEAFKHLGRQTLEEAECQFLANTRLIKIECNEGIAIRAWAENEEGTLCIEFDSLIDCSGNAVASSLLGHSMIDAGAFQRAAITFTLNDVDVTEESTLNFVLLRAIGRAVNNGQLHSDFRRSYLVPGSLHDGNVSLKLGINAPVTYTEDNILELTTKGRKMIHELVSFLQQEVEPFMHARIDHIADEIGLRTGFRPVGKYTLTEEDVLTGAKFDDSIADCCWPIEEWMEDVKVHMHYLPEDTYYQIPQQCLESKEHSNLFFAGKNISATHRAIGSARVMGICLQTGFAAGKLATAFVTESKRILSSRNS